MAELLLGARGLGKSFGARPLFADLSFGVCEGDRLGLVGPNGSGKSTLLRILAGLEGPDSGTLALRKHLRVGYVPQDPAFPEGATPESVLLAALGPEAEPHEAASRAAVALGRAGFEEPRRPVSELSGGWRKRLAVARALLVEPELLLLDEPTNHLDIEGILWLEQVLLSQPRAFVVVSHDRYFLENVARRVLELNRAFAGGFLEVAGGYREFLARKDETLAGQAAYRESLANRVRDELEWLGRKARARTRKGQARVDEAGRLVDELSELRERAVAGTAGIEFSASGRRTRELLVCRGVGKGFGGRLVLGGLSLVLSPGTRLGVVGGNGSGKTTLLRLLDGDLEPDAGRVDRAPHLKVVRFRQDRTLLDPAVSLRRALSPFGDGVVHQGREIHVGGWARRFLFTPEQLDQPVDRLSGGEQARVLLARLMLEEADVLLLDEPTNDLDIPTLEVLEGALLEFPGALVLVTHDRYLLDRVSTRVLALDGRGGVEPFADYSQWEREEERRRAAEEAVRKPRQAAPRPTVASSRPRKLGYHEQREWEGMEAAILAAEAEAGSARDAAHDPAIATDAPALQQAHARLQAAEAAVEHLYARWAELESKRG